MFVYVCVCVCVFVCLHVDLSLFIYSNTIDTILGTDEKAIIEVICKRASEQRLELVKTYREVYGKDLKKELHGELSGNFRDVILGLCLSPVEFDAEQLRKAMKVSLVVVKANTVFSGEIVVMINTAGSAFYSAAPWCLS